ncbi:hypothetical protein FQN50_008783 [Emmonsiellopsis sp. PD_5]|nr:hypothetical protein FQN50_008783 [Emmonsiellopsis sp. PD_5]
MEVDAAPDKEHPLAGVILCCTSILPESREELAAVATQMGAVHKFDLTSDVTHLIVGEINTPKYKYVAKERSDIKVLKAEWVEAVRASWVQGGDTNLHRLEEEYRYPTFTGLSICLTGFEDMHYRNFLQKTITENGAEFRRDLTKSVTHLIARTGEGQKYKYATMWKITVVSMKWLEDSLERGMVLDESLYDPLTPVEEQGIGAWNRSTLTNLVKRPKATSNAVQRPRKLRKVASVKLSGQNEDVWADIVGNGLKTSGSSSSFQNDANMKGIPPVTTIVQEPKSFASETTLADKPRLILPESTTQQSEPTGPARGFWFGSRFFISGFSSSQTKILETHLLSRDAKIVPSRKALVGNTPADNSSNMYILVPYNLPRSKIPSIDDFEDELEIVTDLWIEKCLHNNSLVPPEAHITSTPFPKFPIPVCSTGFSGIDLLHLSKLVKVMGATYDEYLTPKASVLICNTTNPNPEKLRHVSEWNIPAVIADWLWISVQTGERKPFDPYIIHAKQPQPLAPPYRSQKESGKRVDNRGHEIPLQGAKPPVPDLTASHQRSAARHRQQRQEIPQHQKEVAPSRDTSAALNNNVALQELSPNSPNKASRSPSPSKHDKDPTLAVPPPPKDTPVIEHLDRKDPKDSNPNPKTSLDLALTELLRQKRLASTKSSSSTIDDKDNSNTNTNNDPHQPRKRRKRLLGRANSHASTSLGPGPATTTDAQQRAISRASSIDTMNEDGYGSVVDGLDSPSTKAHSNAPSFSSLFATKKTDRTEAQRLLESRLDMFRTNEGLAGEYGHGGHGQEDEEQPPMTQLGYEDPDAAAMRAKITNGNRGGGGGGEEERGSGGVYGRGEGAGKGLVIGKVKDHEILDGWGGRRRTRRYGKGVVREGL